MFDLNEIKQIAKNLTVLYVEDEENSLRETKSLLEMFFQKVDTARDGLEGLEKYKKNHYDLVITDISMPKMDGVEMIREIKKINKDQKVIVISAHSDVHYLIPLINLNINGFILKPIEASQFFTTLKNIIEMIMAKKLLENFNQVLAQELEEKSKELARKYIYDEKTGLLNRNALKEELRDEKDKSLIVVDIKDFGSINLVYGFEKGDKLLKYFGEFLKNILINDKLFYIETDKFVIVTKKEKNEIKQLINTILKELENREYFEIEGDKIYINLIFAIAYREKELCKKVRLALEEIKKYGHYFINFYHKDSPLEKFQKEIHIMKPIILKAIKEDMVIPYYQAIYNNKTKKVEKYEVLSRIVYNDELTPPGKFIQIAEHLKFIPEITKIIINKATQNFHNKSYELSFNLSDLDLKEEYLYEFLLDVCKNKKIPPQKIVLEILENISSEEVNKSILHLQKLQKAGFKIAIDDFGTQNSNFEKLLTLKVDYIKIDGKFIKNLDSNEQSLIIVKAIKQLSDSINTKTIAEFVHNEEIFNIINNIGIDYTQGYYIAPPKKDIK